MVVEIIRAIIYSTCFIVTISLSFFLDMLYEDGLIVGDSASLIVISPVILINIAFGFFTDKYRQLLLYSIYGSLILTAVAYIENYFVPAEQPIQPDYSDLAFSNPIPYGLIIICVGFLFSFVPLTIGWILGKLKKLMFGK